MALSLDRRDGAYLDIPRVSTKQGTEIDTRKANSHKPTEKELPCPRANDTTVTTHSHAAVGGRQPLHNLSMSDLDG